MTDYTAIPTITALYLEQQQVQSAMYYLRNGGTIRMMVIDPPLPVAAQPSGEMIAATPESITMALSIPFSAPNPPSLVQEALDALAARDDEISQQLSGLGVTNPPRLA